jgi:5-methylcytosine-specific restriction endonuclease McrA
MMTELPDTERSRLFNKGYLASTTRERFISIVELWKRDRSDKLQGHCIDGPVASAEPLLTAYLRMWNLRSQVRTFFQCNGVKPFLDKALNCETEIENIADVSNICSVASDIFREYHEYHRQWSETRDHMKAERKLVNHSKRKRLLADLKARDGEHCRECGNRVSDSDLRIDHIRPVSDGGPSALENLQLLCHACNTKKGNSTTAS